MKHSGWVATLFLLAVVGVLVACAGPQEPTPEREGVAELQEEVALEPASVEEGRLPDPGPEEAQEVEDIVQRWLAEQLDEDGIFNIPQKAGYDLAGTLAAFHTVHQEDADTYSVCVDFEDGESTYDVDFYVDRTEDGLVIADHFLHKVSGEEIQ